MRVRPGRRVVAVLLWTATILAGCAGGAGSTGSRSDPPASRTPSVVPSSGLVTANPTGEAGPTVPTPPNTTEPPAASLSAEGGDPVAGQLGSYTWLGGGSDSPWLPGSAIRVGVGEPLVVVLASDIAVADWSARRVPAGTVDGSGGVALGSGTETIRFTAQDVGTWSVQVMVRFADGVGDAAYYWAIDAR